MMPPTCRFSDLSVAGTFSPDPVPRLTDLPPLAWNDCKHLFMSPTTTITYEVKVPVGTDTQGLATVKANNFNVKSTPTDRHKAYYKALREAIEEARNQVGEELTVWRDRVGKAELMKKPKKTDEEEEGEEPEM